MIHSGMSGMSQYPCTLQFIQQLDFCTTPSYTDLSGLNDITAIPQSCSVGHHLVPSVDNNSIHSCQPMSVDNNSTHSCQPMSVDNNSIHSCQPMSEFASGRSLANLCMPSTAAYTDSPTVQGLCGNYLHFQPYSNHMAFRDNSYHNAINKSHQFSLPTWSSNSKALAVAGSARESMVAANTIATLESVKEQQSCKDKKEKAKRVRFIKPGCSDLCRRCCKQKISQSMREDIFNKYWDLEDDAKKKEFIAQNAIKMPMMKCKEGSRRSFSVDWAFLVKGESFSVCKLFFLHTLDIPENTAYAAVKDSTFFNSDTPVVKARGHEKDRSKPTWFETDLDNYNLVEKKSKYSREARYESFTKNDRFSQMGPGCTKLCRRNCQSKFTREERLAIFNEYRSLCNIRKQREYISKYINRMERKRIRAGESTRRGCSIQWNLSSKCREISVCKTFFLHTVGISERAAYNIGLQNQIQPVKRAVKNSLENRSSNILSGQGKSFFSIVAKEKLKSAIKLSRRQKKVVKYVRETEEAMSGECYDLLKENRKISASKRKKGKHKYKKRKQAKTVQVKKMKVEKVYKEETRDEEHEHDKQKSGTCLKPSTTLLNIPVKKRENRTFKLPIFRIKKGKVFPVLRKQRNPYKRKEVPMKHTYSLCPENCRKKCRRNLAEEARREIFKEFWSLKNMEEQRKYIAKCVKKIAKPTCTCLIARGKRRGYTIAWSLRCRGLDVAVCKTFFMHVLQVSDSVVYKAIRESECLTSDVTVGQCRHFTGRNHMPKSPADVTVEQCKHFTGRNHMAKPPADVTVEQCKHFTGRNHMAKPPADVTVGQCKHFTGRTHMAKPPADVTVEQCKHFTGRTHMPKSPADVTVGQCKHFTGRNHMAKPPADVTVGQCKHFTGRNHMAKPPADVTVGQCKHFTGRTHMPKSLPPVEVVDAQKMKYEGDKDSQEAGRKEDLISEEDCVNEQRETAAYNTDNSCTTQHTNTGDKMGCSELAQILVTSDSASRGGSKDVLTTSQHDERAAKIHAQLPHNSQHDERAAKIHAQLPHNSQHDKRAGKIHAELPHCTHSELCHIEANYETLIPGLHKRPQDSSHILQVHYPPQQLTSYGSSEKVITVPNPTKAPISASSICHSEFWQKPVDLFHPVFSNNPSARPAMLDTCVEPGQNFLHPRDLPSHMTFPQNGTHHSYFPAQANSSGNYSTSFTQLYTNIPAPYTNYANQKHFTDDTMTRADFCHNTRFHSFPTPVIIPRHCVPNCSDHRAINDLAHPDSQMVRTPKNTDNDILLSNKNKPVKLRKKKVKSSPSCKLKDEKVKTPQVRKNIEKKPFTKHIKEGCLNRCKKKCGLKVPQEARQQIFNEFWNLDNDMHRREYILPIVNKVPKKTCSGVNSRRCCTIEWSLLYKEKRHIVCKRFFLDTFDLGEKFVKTVFDKVERKGGSMEDLRGRHCKRSNMFVQEQEEIEKQIRSVSTLKSFQCMACKKDFTRWCLSQGAVISQLYKMYSDKRRAEGKKPACRTSYTEVCNKNLYLKNSTHQEYVCDSCAAHTHLPQGSLSDSSSTFR